ncbi:Putative ribosome biogenesis GTPase RsgA, partial [Lacticaseibacillus paracasei subsp. tolerans Lpl14]
MSEDLTGRIIKQISGYYDIAVNGTTYRTRGRGSLRNDKITPLVG